VEVTNDRLPPLQTVEYYAGVYEAAKAKAKRLDFCDLLLRYAGRFWTGNHACPLGECPPQGPVPDLPVWVHDEMQDCSALTALVFRRLSAPAKFIYLFGDVWQAIFDWAGADHRVFSTWPVQREEVLPLSYRCPSNVLAAADAVMLRGGYAPRAFRSQREGGMVEHLDNLGDALAAVEVGTPTLVLARTNEYARAAAQRLDEMCTPWRPTRGAGGFAAPARAAGVRALLALEQGGSVDATGLWRLLELLPQKAEEGTLIARGTKTRFKDAETRTRLDGEVPGGFTLRDLDIFSDSLRCRIADATAEVFLAEGPARMLAAGRRHGLGALDDPKCLVGTAHSSKGMGAQHVIAINRIPYPTQKAIETPAGMDEERRLWYTVLTRSRERLVITEAGGQRFDELSEC